MSRVIRGPLAASVMAAVIEATSTAGADEIIVTYPTGENEHVRALLTYRNSAEQTSKGGHLDSSCHRRRPRVALRLLEHGHGGSVRHAGRRRRWGGLVKMRALILAALVAATPAAAEVPVPVPNPLRGAQTISPPPPPTVRRSVGRVLCRERSEIVGILNRRFNETQRSFGLQNDRRVLELYASPSGSWTALVTMPNGTSCVIAAGEAWTILPPAPVGDPT